ncbi:hypothetical protein ACFLR7_07050 [Acidobacteriota bacterium]
MFKISYTGRRKLSVGLETVYMRAPLRMQDNMLSAFSGLLTLRYYF